MELGRVIIKILRDNLDRMRPSKPMVDGPAERG